MNEVKKVTTTPMAAQQGNNKIFNVYCRFRPLNTREKHLGKDKKTVTDNTPSLVQIESSKCLYFNGYPYLFDGIYDEECSQTRFFSETIEEHLHYFMRESTDLTILTYGQTSSGKTWTIDGSFYHDNAKVRVDQDDNTHHGILPRILKIICSTDRGKHNMRESINVAFYEIYCEKIIDLFAFLTNSGEKKEVKLFEDKSNDRLELRCLTWRDLTHNNDKDAYEFIKTSLFAARGHRHFASTEMNANSSRSHTILDICFGRSLGNNDNIEEKHLRIIDLAGSERLAKTQSRGQVMQEGIKINESLMYLKRLIDSLAEKKERIDKEKNTAGNERNSLSVAGLDYRSTKLTRILFNAFRSWRSRVILILCCSPSRDNINETTNTLKFGSNAKLIRAQLKLMQKRNSDRKSHGLADMAKGHADALLHLEGKNQLIDSYRTKINEYEISIEALNQQLQSAFQQLQERDESKDEARRAINEEPQRGATVSHRDEQQKNADNDKEHSIVLAMEKEERKKVEREKEVLMRRLTSFEKVYDRCRETMKMQEDIIRRNTQDIMEMQNEINFFDKFRKYLIEALGDDE